MAMDCCCPRITRNADWVPWNPIRIKAFWRRLAEHQPGSGQAASRENVNRTAERLLDTYGNAVLRLAYSYVHNREDAEEILQDVLMKYLQSASEFASADHEKAWLLRVAANLSKNRIDYNRLRDTDELSETLAAEQREDLSFVWEAVKQLPPAHREAIHLFYYEGYTTGEIAEILGRKESSVRSDLRRGREKLKAILKGEYVLA